MLRRTGLARTATLAAVLCPLLWSTVAAQPTGPLELILENETGPVGSIVEVSVTLEHPDDTVSGFGFGVCHDPAVLALIDVTTDYPFGFFLQIGADGFSSATALGTHALGDPLLPGVDVGVIVAHYQILAPIETPLEFCEDQGVPPVAIAVLVGGGSYVPGWTNGSVGPERSFRRGDTNGDGALDLADVIFLELYLFAGGEVPGCINAGDSNDDQLIDIADAVTVLMYLFIGGPPPNEPFVDCGVVEDDFSCDESPCP